MTRVGGWNDDRAVGGGLKTPDKTPQKHSVNIFFKMCSFIKNWAGKCVFA